MAVLDVSLEELAGVVGMTKGTLRNAVSGYDQIRLGRVHRIARALHLSVQEITADGNDGVPDEPPAQPEGPKGPPRRQEKERENKGPKRARDQASAA
jgi:transcriptional regulator with XRE-family HTH domain